MSLFGGVLVICVYFQTPEAILLKTAWEYNVLEVFTNTSDSSLLDISLKFERSGRSGGGVSGFIDLNTDLTDEYKFEMKLLRSVTGTNPYVPAPFSISPTPYLKTLNGVYKNIMMESLKDCSDILQFKGNWEGPAPKKRYTFNRCMFDTAKMPSFMPPGYYKVQGIVTGPVNVFVQFHIKLEFIQ